MLQDLLKDIEPALSLITALLSIAVLGFIIRFSLLVKEALSQRAEALKEQRGVVEERLQKATEDLARTEKWYERETQKLKEQLSSILKRENVTIQTLVENPSIGDLKVEIKETIGQVLTKMLSIEHEISEENYTEISDPQWHIDMAKGFTLANNWLQAADHYSKYLEICPDDWNVYFLRAVSYANSRTTKQTDVAALMSLGQAIALAPDDIDSNTRARLHGYRGAGFKRIGRLKEAESELLLAQTWAEKEYEVNDIRYNLASVYAMMHEKDKMLAQLVPLVQDDTWRKYIKLRKKYFDNYWNDPDFRKICQMHSPVS